MEARKKRGTTTNENVMIDGDLALKNPAEAYPFETDEDGKTWIDRKKLYDLTLWEGDKIFLRLLENDDEPFFLLKLGYDGDELVSAVLNGERIK